MSILRIIIISTILFVLSILVYYFMARDFFDLLLEKNAFTYWFLIFFAGITFGNYEIDLKRKYGIRWSSRVFIIVPLLRSKEAPLKEKFLYIFSIILMFAIMMGFSFLYIYPSS